MKEYIGIKYEVNGVYGKVDYVKVIPKNNLDSTLNKYILGFNNTCADANFSVEIRNEKGETLFSQYDIEGLPSYIRMDMGTYFRMAQLREMSQNKYSYTINSYNDYDRLLKDAIEKIPEIISEKFAKELKRDGAITL